MLAAAHHARKQRPRQGGWGRRAADVDLPGWLGTTRQPRRPQPSRDRVAPSSSPTSSEPTMPDPVTDEQLAAYLQEQLPLAELAAVEKALREDEPLRRRAAALALRRDLPYHSV